MLIRLLFQVLITLAVLSTSQTSVAKNYCDISDFKDSTDFTKNYQAYVSLVFSTDTSNFSQRQKNLELGASALFEALPINVFGSFSSFETWRSELKKKLNYNSNESESTSYFATTLTDIDAQAYRDCIRQFHPLSITAVSQNRDDVTFVIDWKPPPLVDVSGFTLKHSSAINKIDTNDVSGFTYKPQNEKYLSYKLTQNTPFHMVVESEPRGYSATIDYMVVRYNACRIPANDIESLTTETVEGFVSNTRGNDRARNRAWLNAQTKLKKGEHKDLTIVSEKYDDKREDSHDSSGSMLDPGPRLYDRYYYFTVTYNPIYWQSEHVLCGLDLSSNATNP